MKIEVNVPDVTAEDVANVIYQRLRGSDYGPDKIDDMVGKAVAKAVAEIGQSVVREMLEPHVRAALESGWAETNNYGEPTGKRTSVSDLIRGQLTWVKPSSYHDSDRSWGTQLVRTSVEAAIKNELGAEVARLKTELRAKVDAVLGTQITEAIRGAVGLK